VVTDLDQLGTDGSEPCQRTVPSDRVLEVHWNQYTAGLARDAKAREAAVAAFDAPEAVESTPSVIETKPPRTKGKALLSVAESTEAGAA
jgi:hypothetical protein